MQEYAKHFAWWLLSTFWGESARKNISLYPETMLRNRPKFYRKLRGRKLVKNFEIF